MQASPRSGFFDAADGLKLYRDYYPPPGAPRGNLLVVHGYADHCGRYAEVSKRLAAAGFAVMAFDYRGHGQAGGRRGHCDSFDEFLGDLERACRELTAAAGERPMALVGHSHGSLIILRALAAGRTPPSVVAAALSSPYLGLRMKVPALKVAAAKLASRVFPRLALANGIDPATLSHDPAIVRARVGDRFCHSVATSRWFTEATAAQAFVAAHAARVTLPTLWLVGGADPIADPAASRRVYEQVGGDKTYRDYEGYFHEVFNETGRERVFTDLEQWLSARFPPA